MKKENRSKNTDKQLKGRKDLSAKHLPSYNHVNFSEKSLTEKSPISNERIAKIRKAASQALIAVSRIAS